MALDVIIVLAVVFLVICACAQRARKMLLRQQQLQQQQQINANVTAVPAPGRSAAATHRQLTRSSYRSSQQNDALSTATLHAVCTRDLERGDPRRAFSGFAISGDTSRSSSTRGSGGLRGLQTARSNMVPHSTASPRAAVPQMTRFEEGAVLVTGIAEARPAELPVVTVDYTQQSGRGRSKKSLPTAVAVPVIGVG
jgi:hypothetical protein